MRKILAVAAATCLALTLAGCGSSGSGGSGGASSSGAAQQAQEQVFETEAARVTYRETIEPTTGNAMVNFALENKTDSTVLVSGENVIVNGEFSVGTLGGSATPIAPGTTGSVSILFGYSVQTTLQSIDEVETVSCDLVMRDNDSLSTVVGSVPVSVSI